MSNDNYKDPYGYANDSNPYGESYELNQYSQGQEDDFVTFMNSINVINQELDNYKQLIELIEFNQKKILQEINEDQELSTRSQLDSLITQASSLQQQLKSQIKTAQSKAGNDNSKKAQAERSKDDFLRLIQNYRIIEANYREQNKIQASTQYKIVKPDATEEEVEDAINDVGGQQIFSQAILNASRRGEAKTALAEVQSRHRELQRLEKTMAELTQLFHDMEELVAEQNVAVQNVNESVEEAQKDLELGLGHTDKAVESARKARRKKCWCIWILILVIVIILVVVIVPIAVHFS
ncbi:hypothetical protein WICMUC_004602 [Wickerhamomyces mucosus]|uniref:t-SNARE coiled-coil homology domain-containing protein n=1 Tax=Wickerhamomyces mucosus TaxID=1378264 RepID=A0A9P8PGH3_9ASCO|nr:hypothetical protein WICMUC_004602 [Wickerhamomyces mucosus]